MSAEKPTFKIIKHFIYIEAPGKLININFITSIETDNNQSKITMADGSVHSLNDSVSTLVHFIKGDLMK